MSWTQTFKDLIGYEPPQKNSQVGNLLDAQTDKNQITMIGTMGAGKSSHIAGLIKTADRKVSTSRDTEYPFRYIIDEGSSNIIHDVSALRNGHFPPKTGASKRSYMEPGVTFEWEHRTFVGGKAITLSKKRARMPILDLAGEDLVRLIDKVKEARTLDSLSTLDAENAERITNKVNQSAGLMLIIKATRAQGLGFELEKEPCDINGMSIYSDANLARMVNGIIRYKHQHPESPPLRKIFVVITAWDGLAPVAKKISQITGTPFDPLEDRISSESLDKFVYAFFPSTHAAITSLGLNVQYFPSFFLVERDSKGEPICWDGTASPKIKRIDLFDPSRKWEDNANTIYDSEKWFFKELDALQDFATLE